MPFLIVVEAIAALLRVAIVLVIYGSFSYHAASLVFIHNWIIAVQHFELTCSSTVVACKLSVCKVDCSSKRRQQEEMSRQIQHLIPPVTRHERGATTHKIVFGVMGWSRQYKPIILPTHVYYIRTGIDYTTGLIKHYPTSGFEDNL